MLFWFSSKCAEHEIFIHQEHEVVRRMKVNRRCIHLEERPEGEAEEQVGVGVTGDEEGGDADGEEGGIGGEEHHQFQAGGEGDGPEPASLDGISY